MTASLLFVDSFDDYTTPSQRWPGIDIGFFMQTSGARTGTQCLESGNNGNDLAPQNFVPRASYIVGFAVKVNNVPISETRAIILVDGTGPTDQVTLTVDAGGTIRVRRGGSGGTLLGTASSILPFGAWHYLEFKCTINSAAGVVQVWLDGVSILSLTGQNTQSTGNANAGVVRIANFATHSNFDDLYILDPTIGAYSGPLGDVKMVCSMPSGNGTTNNYTTTFASFINGHTYVVGETFKDSNNNVQRCTVGGTAAGSAPTWATTGGVTTTSGGATFVVLGSGANPGAANWMAVSEIPPDDNSSYVTDATPGDIDRYTFPSIAGSTVKAVAVNIRGEKDDAGTRTIRAAVKSASTTADSGTDLALSLSSYADFQGVFETDPNTGVPWTVAGVNAAEFGLKTIA
jgi:hypothetical protein